MGAYKCTSILTICFLMQNNLLAATGQFEQAVRYFELKNYSKSIQTFNLLVKKNPQKGLYWFNLANSHFMSGQFRKALDSYQRVIALKSNLTPAAQLYIIKSYRMMGLYREANNFIQNNNFDFTKTLLIEYNEERSKLQDIALDKAAKFYEQSDYDKTKTELNIAIELNPQSENANNAKMLMAICDVKINNIKDASKEFQQISKSNSSSELKSEAKLLDLMFREKRVESHYWLSLEISAGYDSNLYYDPPTVSKIPTAVGYANINAGYDLFHNENHKINLGAQIGFDYYLYDQYQNQVRNTGFLHYIFDNYLWWIKAGPFTEYYLFGGTPYLFKPGADISVARKLKNSEAGISLVYNQKIAQRFQYSYLDGEYFESKLFYSYFSTKQESTTPFLIAGQESAGELLYVGANIPFSNTFYGGGLTYYFIKPMGLLNAIEFTTNIKYLLKEFTPVSQPGSITRKDRILSVSFLTAYTMNKQFKIFINPAYVKNISTMGTASIVDKNFNQTTIIGGIAWEMM